MIVLSRVSPRVGSAPGSHAGVPGLSCSGRVDPRAAGGVGHGTHVSMLS